MKLTKIFLLATCTLLPITGFAFFCPTNFNQINIGDSIDQVKLLCGKATMEATKVAEEKVPQEWDYYLQQSGSITSSQQGGTFKMTVAFGADGTVANISLNGIGISNTTACGGKLIRLGDTIETVKNNCGSANFINKQQLSPAATAQMDTQNQLTEWTYNSNPPMVLVFQQGKLIEKR